MSLRTKNAPFTFEPVSPAQSEVYSGLSCSEDELDEAARASKRRRIEQRAQDYLDGKPLYIISGSLKGPFGKNWTNPWKRTKPHSNLTPTTKAPGQAKPSPAIPVSNAETHREDSNPQSTTSLREKSSISESPGPRNKRSTSGRKPKGVFSSRIGNSRVNSSGTSIPQSSKSRSSTKERDEFTAQPRRSNTESSGESWLKRRPQNDRRIEPQKSPSPTPAGRHKDVTSLPKQRLSTIETPRIPDGATILQTSPISSGFTPINKRQQDFALARTFSPPKELSPKATGSNNLPKSPISNRRRGSIPKNSALGGKNIHRDETSPPNPKKSNGEVVSARDNIPANISHRGENDFKFKYRLLAPAVGSRHIPERVPPQEPIPVNGSANSKGSGVSFYDFARSPQKASSGKPESSETVSRGTERKFLKRGDGELSNIQITSNDGSAMASDDSEGWETDDETTATVESCHITSAQQPPDYAKISREAVSLQSTCFAELKSNTIEGNSAKENEDLQISTQCALSTAQRSFQDALITPDKETHAEPNTVLKRSSKPVGSSEKSGPPGKKITPFCALNSSAQETDNVVFDHNTAVEEALPVNTQALFDAVSPFAVSTAKKVRNKVSFSHNQDNTPTRRGENGPVPVSNGRTDSVPVLDEAQPVSPFQISSFGTTDPASQPTRLPYDPVRASLNAGPAASTEAPATESSLHPTASKFPLTATTSTETRQDGQHVGDLDNFDLNQAIADAGTFLQSWDVDRDLRTFSGNVPSSASVPERQPV
ncbi:hypothetical protein FQN54_006740 [Arachnomyces sp. PD_36]|nr:hypothetical protein FQN54_006740 [Arachnomyces sp. PD_36]